MYTLFNATVKHTWREYAICVLNNVSLLTTTGELWGEQLANSSWSGMMGMLHGGEAEIGVANLYVSITRTKVLDYSAPYNLMVGL